MSKKYVYFVSWWGRRNKTEDAMPVAIPPITAPGYYSYKSESVGETRGPGQVFMDAPVTTLEHVRKMEKDITDSMELEFAFLFNYQLLREEDDGQP